MRKIIISAAISAISLAAVNTHAASITLESLKADIERLESQSSKPSLFKNAQVSGLIEVESNYSQSSDNSVEGESSVALATFELAIASQINRNTHADVTFLYEEASTEFDVDTAVVEFSNQASSITLGQTYLPFGSFETNQVNDTLALEIAETRNTVLIASTAFNNINVDAYMFANDDNKVDQNGLRLTYNLASFTMGLDYINNIKNSDGFIAAIDDGAITATGEAAATSLYFSKQFGNIQLLAEHLSIEKIATTNITDTHIEATYGLANSTISLALQQTEDAAIISLPESRVSFTTTFNVLKNTGTAIEIWHDKDYSVSNGGSGESSNNIMFQVGVEF